MIALNYTASQKLIEVVVNHGLKSLIVKGHVDMALTIEAMKLIYNSKINVLALAVRDTHFLPVLIEAKKAGKDVIIVGPKRLSQAL